MFDVNDPDLVGKIRKNAEEEIYVKTKTVDEVDFFELRVWCVDKKSGQSRPSKAGFLLRVDQYPEFKKVLNSLEDQFRKKGLLAAEEAPFAAKPLFESGPAGVRKEGIRVSGPMGGLSRKEKKKRYFQKRRKRYDK